jgi:hypothetical protein
MEHIPNASAEDAPATPSPPPDIYDEVAYAYDGSLEGLLSAVFAAYERHEHPTDIAPEERLQLLMDDELHDLVPQRRDVETALLRLHDDPVPILSRRVLTNARLSRFLNFLEIAPQAHVVHLGIEVVEHGLPRELAAASQDGLVARLDR